MIHPFNDGIKGIDIQEYCTNDEQTIKDTLLELRINKYIKYDPETNMLIAGPEPYTKWDKPIIDDVRKKAKDKNKDKER